MNRFEVLAADYLAARRVGGFRLTSQARILAGFVAYLAETNAATITIDNSLTYATRPAQARPIWWAHRLSVVRGFAAWAHTFDATVEIPPARLLPASASRRTPHIYTDDDISRLMAGARRLVPASRAATHETLIGFLAVTGMRVGEAINLCYGDVDFGQSLVIIRDGKFGKRRVVPLHPTTLAMLTRYSLQRAELCPLTSGVPLFVSNTGTKLPYNSVHVVFARLVDELGIVTESGRRPRMHDLRHRFAVETLLGWYRAGDDVAALMPRLSTFLGHVKPSNTYWYLSANPELFGLVAARLDCREGRS